MGDCDFQFTVDVPDQETILKLAAIIERHGLDTNTHQLVEIDRIGEFVDNI